MVIPPIISKETWEAAKARREHNKKFSPRNTQRVYLTQHILYCSECGYPFKISSSRGKALLICRGMELYPHLYHCRNPRAMYEEPIAKRLWETVAKVAGSEQGLETAIKAKVEMLAGKKEEIEKELEDIEAKKGRLAEERERVSSAYRKGYIRERELNLQLRAVQAEEEQYEAEEERLKADLKLVEDANAVYQQARQLIPAMKEKLAKGLTLEEKKGIIRLLVHRATLDRDGNLTVEFKTPVVQTDKPISFTEHTSCGIIEQQWLWLI